VVVGRREDRAFQKSRCSAPTNFSTNRKPEAAAPTPARSTAGHAPGRFARLVHDLAVPGSEWVSAWRGGVIVVAVVAVVPVVLEVFGRPAGVAIEGEEREAPGIVSRQTATKMPVIQAK